MCCASRQRRPAAAPRARRRRRPRPRARSRRRPKSASTRTTARWTRTTMTAVITPSTRWCGNYDDDDFSSERCANACGGGARGAPRARRRPRPCRAPRCARRRRPTARARAPRTAACRRAARASGGGVFFSDGCGTESCGCCAHFPTGSPRPRRPARRRRGRSRRPRRSRCPRRHAPGAHADDEPGPRRRRARSPRRRPAPTDADVAVAGASECTNGRLDAGIETDVDCGGSCPPCGPGKARDLRGLLRRRHVRRRHVLTPTAAPTRVPTPAPSEVPAPAPTRGPPCRRRSRSPASRARTSTRPSTRRASRRPSARAPRDIPVGLELRVLAPPPPRGGDARRLSSEVTITCVIAVPLKVALGPGKASVTST